MNNGQNDHINKKKLTQSILKFVDGENIVVHGGERTHFASALNETSKDFKTNFTSIESALKIRYFCFFNDHPLMKLFSFGRYEDKVFVVPFFKDISEEHHFETFSLTSLTPSSDGYRK